MSELSQEEVKEDVWPVSLPTITFHPPIRFHPPSRPSRNPPIINRTQSPLAFESQNTPIDEKCFSELSKAPSDNLSEMKEVGFEQDRSKCEGIFKEPSKPIDINMPSSSSKARARAPPQRSDSETSSIHMEVDEASGCADKIGGNTDIDSGFENMEVDEADVQKKDVQRQRTTSSSTEMTEEQLHATVARVLRSTFKQPADGRLYLPETAEQLRRDPHATARDVASSAIMEVLARIAGGGDPFKDLNQQPADACDTSSVGSFSASPTQTFSPSPSPVGACPIPLLTMRGAEDTKDTPLILAANFLMDSYNRVSVEERNHPKKSSIPPLSDVLTELRAQIIHYTTLVVQGYIVPNDDASKSPLLAPMLQQTMPRGFLTELVTRTHANEALFSSVFSPILQCLFRMMQNASIVGDEHRTPIQTLFELADIRCGSRPICTLITKQVQFVPEPCTPAQGREVMRSSFLGPFISVSVFAEDEPKVAEKFFSGNSSSDKSLIQTLQLELENTRGLQHRIFHFMMANQGSRDRVPQLHRPAAQVQ
ncbi:hypothetical protein NQ318_017306 [Aromia moschata]|uniref:Ubiquitin conjugation factor E4 core domain-containing protein n=1 Tax=Aromia moschata TaxID=1265417 RepID=A0AAV8XXU4_9CUCU|nr:hypothetical protein NQ318_017306 [Aromia moschata]